LTVLTLAACSGGTEQPILGQFFAASRLRDHTMLSNFATVAFEPAAQGIITTFTITKVALERSADGEVVSKAVTIDAPVKLPGGQTVQKTLVVTLRRAPLTEERSPNSRWIVTAITDASGSVATPLS